LKQTNLHRLRNILDGLDLKYGSTYAAPDKRREVLPREEAPVRLRDHRETQGLRSRPIR
jgi:hypothetical protein